MSDHVWVAAWLNILSGALIAALGLYLLSANPRKDWNRLFALLATFWGAQIVASNVVRVTDNAAIARFAGEIGLAFIIPLPFFVVMFAASFPRPAGRMWGLLLLVPATLTLALLFARPDLLLRGIGENADGSLAMRWGPAFPHLVVAPLYAAFFYALFVMMRRVDENASPIERRQVTFVLAAFAAFVAYNVPVQLHFFGGPALGLRAGANADRAEAIVIALVMLAGLALLAVLATRARRDRLVLASIAIPGAAAILSIAVQEWTGERFDLLGLVRLGSVALIVYAIARYQLFDIDLRVKQVAATLAAVLAALALASAAWLGIRALDVTGSLGGMLVAIAAILAFVPLLRVASRVADRIAPNVNREGEHLYLRKIDVYRAAVETAIAGGWAVSTRRERSGHPSAHDAIESGLDDAALLEMREKLALTQRDHDIVVSMALARADTAAPGPDLRPGGVVFGKYAIDSIIAEGGYGRVFLARDRILQRPVVIKELQARWRGNAAVVKTFLREAQIAGRLNHPNIVGVLEVERHGEDHFIVMEHMSGGSLEGRLQQGALAEADALRIARAVLAALDAAHAQGVVHRDVKPANILLGARGEVKLTDFGIAQMGTDDPQRTISGLTSGALAAAGTLQYMSPEQARGRPLDGRSDLYAVGALLYRMLTGRPHIDLAGMDEYSARTAVAEARAPAAPAGALGAAVAKALAPDPTGRWQSAREFAAALAGAPLASAAKDDG